MYCRTFAGTLFGVDVHLDDGHLDLGSPNIGTTLPNAIFHTWNAYPPFQPISPCANAHVFNKILRQGIDMTNQRMHNKKGRRKTAF